MGNAEEQATGKSPEAYCRLAAGSNRPWAVRLLHSAITLTRHGNEVPPKHVFSRDQTRWAHIADPGHAQKDTVFSSSLSTEACLGLWKRRAAHH